MHSAIVETIAYWRRHKTPTFLRAKPNDDYKIICLYNSGKAHEVLLFLYFVTFVLNRDVLKY
jgi:hypothetical protein